LAAVVEDFLAIDAQDGVARHEVAQLAAEAKRMDRRRVVGEDGFLLVQLGAVLTPQPTGIPESPQRPVPSPPSPRPETIRQTNVQAGL
jgi:hypothetical protein